MVKEKSILENFGTGFFLLLGGLVVVAMIMGAIKIALENIEIAYIIGASIGGVGLVVLVFTGAGYLWNKGLQSVSS